MLNPGESVNVLLLASSNKSLPNKPKVSLRAKGITGFEKTKSGKKSDFLSSLIPAFLGLITAFMLILSRRRSLFIRDEKENGDDKFESKGVHSDDQRRIMAYICELNDLDTEAKYYRSLNASTAYWSESDRLAISAIKIGTKDSVQKVKQILITLIDYADVNKSSTAIILFNIARLCFWLGEADEAQKYLEESKSLGGDIIEARLKIDPIFP